MNLKNTLLPWRRINSDFLPSFSKIECNFVFLFLPWLGKWNSLFEHLKEMIIFLHFLFKLMSLAAKVDHYYCDKKVNDLIWAILHNHERFLSRCIQLLMINFRCFVSHGCFSNYFLPGFSSRLVKILSYFQLFIQPELVLSEKLQKWHHFLDTDPDVIIVLIIIIISYRLRWDNIIFYHRSRRHHCNNHHLKYARLK